MVVIHILENLIVKREDSYALNSLAGSLAAAVAVPALFVSPYAVAQSGASRVPELAPVQVEGEASPYQPDSVQSSKMTAPLLDTPRSVQVVPKQVISDQSATSLQDVLQNSPGITFAAGEGGRAGGDLPVIRGQNAASSLFLDGVRDVSMQARDTFNLEQVEIIKGPDSVYAGRGGAGGSINLVSKAPKAKDAIEATGQIGTDSNYRGTLDSNWRLGEKSAFRLNVMGTKGDVPGRDKAVDFSRWGVAPSLTLGMGTPTRITLSYYHYQNDSMPDYSIPYDPTVGLPVTETLGISRKNFYGLAGRDHMDTSDNVGTVDFQHDFSDKLKLRSVVRYGHEIADYIATQPQFERAPARGGRETAGLRQVLHHQDIRQPNRPERRIPDRRGQARVRPGFRIQQRPANHVLHQHPGAGLGWHHQMPGRSGADFAVRSRSERGLPLPHRPRLVGALRHRHPGAVRL